MWETVLFVVGFLFGFFACWILVMDLKGDVLKYHIAVNDFHNTVRIWLRNGDVVRRSDDAMKARGRQDERNSKG